MKEGFLLKFTLKNQILKPENTSSALPISQIPFWNTPPLDPHYPYSKQLQSSLQGKQLLLDELSFPIELIQEHYEHGYVAYQKGVANFLCTRCGNKDKSLFATFLCARCHHDCTYCRKCIMMGRVSECTPLIEWLGPQKTWQVNSQLLQWNGELSRGQKKAAKAVVEAIKKNEELLIWAVCGAGKTELLFSGIEQALQQNKSICLATPRTDVVLELAPRLKAVFPKTDIIALYGGSEDRNKTAQLTIATTHQLIRYYRAFDVVIIDEVDAFPFSYDKMLQYAVKKVKKERSATIYLSATPDKTLQKQVKQKKLKACIIPSRFHGHPLPVPIFRWCGNWRRQLKKQQLPHHIEKWIDRHLSMKKQAFLFVPSIQTLTTVVAILQKKDPRIKGVYAEDFERKEKVLAFRSGEIPILVTTTILERGITVPHTDVAVFGADDKVFTESALIQIAGRIGRSADSPTGEAVFFHYGKTKAMVGAKFQIEKMNGLVKKAKE